MKEPVSEKFRKFALWIWNTGGIMGSPERTSGRRELMDWSAFAGCFGVMTCVLSVERLADGRCGTVRIVTRGIFTASIRS